jgi:hypothetical protein
MAARRSFRWEERDTRKGSSPKRAPPLRFRPRILIAMCPPKTEAQERAIGTSWPHEGMHHIVWSSPNKGLGVWAPKSPGPGCVQSETAVCITVTPWGLFVCCSSQGALKQCPGEDHDPCFPGKMCSFRIGRSR